MCLRLSHLFRLYPLYLLLATALLGVAGVAGVASPVPRANARTSQRRSILLRIGDYDWEHSQWKRNSGTLRQSQWQWHKPKTTQRSRRTQVHNDYYRTLKVNVDPSSFDRAQRSLFESCSSVTTLETAIGERDMIKDDESYILAILNLMVTKHIVSGYDKQKSLKDDMKPVPQTPPRPLSLRFGVYDWSKRTWALAKTGTAKQPDFLCFSCYQVCLGFDKKRSEVVEIPPGWRSTPGGKGHIDTHRHRPLVFPFDQEKGDAWSDPDQKHRSLVQFLQDIGDLKKAAGGEITDPESYIRAILRYLSLDSNGVDGQDVGDGEIKRKKGGDGQDVRDSVDRTEVNNSGLVQETGRLAHGDGQEVRGGQEVGDGRDNRTANNAGTEVNNSGIVQDTGRLAHSASKSASIHNLIN
ncbi:hypothetical protein DFH05DRAFT_1527358 [Lentinula detonsa]|uniref:Uncharacterized protein n=1 Tax=Lentinula detonsa TaxID=2804962 RepID=A0A9W8TVD7_9AGAR|nr:hypothetical protein DFH05DRAFT_1527358 [Lentinula detonsa]